MERVRPYMIGRRYIFLGLIAVFVAGSGQQNLWAHDIRVTIPKHSQLTPVQRLNREGVEEIRKQHYEKAEAIFYKAYLYDAADPFTLNNLGYISELQGKLDRAQKFYALASEQGSSARIDRSNAKRLIGKPMTYALNDLKDVPMQVNRMNVQAIDLLSQDRNFEANALLQKTLALDPQNPFTMNNLGVAEEAMGDYDSALKNYEAAANSNSTEPIVVTLKNSWRGKPVSTMAADSARQLKKRMTNLDSSEVRANMLAIRGVSATNQNNWQSARQDFLEAYTLNPTSAFSLNNYGYLAEKNGDLETAKLFYSKARRADNSSARVGLATDRLAEGKHLIAVAKESDLQVDSELNRYGEAARRQTGPIQLIRRGATSEEPAVSPEKQPAPATPNTESPTPN